MTRLTRLAALMPLVLWSCNGGKALPEQAGAFRVTFVGNPDRGTQDNPLVFSATKTTSFVVDVEALMNDRPTEVDPNFNGWVVLTIQPRGKTVQEPLAVKLVDGRASNVKVDVLQSFGVVRIVAMDVGFIPAASAASAACNNSADDDGDGYVDFPRDRGCYYANDDTETGGSGAAGASDVIYFANPRIYDVQKPGSNKDESALKTTRVSIDRGFLLISRVSTDGMYVSDYEGAKWDKTKNAWEVDPKSMSYRNVFAFNYSSPLNIMEGDCLVQLDGTVMEFYGYTELSMPVWKKGDYAYYSTLASKAGFPCAADEQTDVLAGSPCRRAIENLANTPFDLTKMTIDEAGVEKSIWDQAWPGTETERFEGGLIQIDDVEMMTELRKCDTNGNGVVDYAIKAEADCSNDCGDEPACQVYETYLRYGQWTVHFTDALGKEVEINVISTGSLPKFNPRDERVISDDSTKTVLKPKKLGKIVGTLRHLSFGRPPWTIEPRRTADCPDCKNETTKP
jgi:hypothetical protein